GRAFDGGLNTVIRHTAAQRGVHGLADLRVGRMRISVQHRLRRHDLPVLTEPALRDLFSNPGLLQRVQLAVRRKAFECGDFTFDRGGRQDAGTNRRAAYDYCAGPALAESAAKPRALQTEIIPEDVKQRCSWLDIYRVPYAVDLKCDTAHSECSFPTGA